mmetsp:Transcript_19462/g.35393  ORF Transcript_19462/g.35393 Transcript_19462/m.35393 type:complete len:203 (-) Transcript_19462:87-695(-)
MEQWQPSKWPVAEPLLDLPYHRRHMQRPVECTRRSLVLEWPGRAARTHTSELAAHTRLLASAAHTHTLVLPESLALAGCIHTLEPVLPAHTQPPVLVEHIHTWELELQAGDTPRPSSAQPVLVACTGTRPLEPAAHTRMSLVLPWVPSASTPLLELVVRTVLRVLPVVRTVLRVLPAHIPYLVPLHRQQGTSWLWGQLALQT